MIAEAKILAAERLRDDLAEFKAVLRTQYKNKTSQVSSERHKKLSSQYAEVWLVELATDPAIKSAIGSEVVADLNVHFQRLLTFSEHATQRSKYETELNAILTNYLANVVVPIKQQRGRTAIDVPAKAVGTFKGTVFIGQSFLPNDTSINACVAETLQALNLKVVTGEKPRADRISEKVKRLIEEQEIFVGIFTRRDKVAGKKEWTTSAWVIDEKAYALGRQKRLILIKEEGVGSIGGIQGDYEYFEFSRGKLELLVVKLIQLFEISNNGLRA